MKSLCLVSSSEVECASTGCEQFSWWVISLSWSLEWFLVPWLELQDWKWWSRSTDVVDVWLPIHPVWALFARKSSIQLERVVLKLSVLSFPSSFVGEIVLNAEVKWNEQHPDVAVVIFFKDVWRLSGGQWIWHPLWTFELHLASERQGPHAVLVAKTRCVQEQPVAMPLWSASIVFCFALPLFWIYVPGTPLKAVFIIF